MELGETVAEVEMGATAGIVVLERVVLDLEEDFDATVIVDIWAARAGPEVEATGASSVPIVISHASIARRIRSIATLQ